MRETIKIRRATGDFIEIRKTYWLFGLIPVWSTVDVAHD